MQDHIETPLSIPEIARGVGCTQKTLEHRMRSAMGATPAAVYRRLRLNAVLRLVQDTDLTVAEIAGRCGYDNASAMTRPSRPPLAKPRKRCGNSKASWQLDS